MKTLRHISAIVLASVLALSATAMAGHQVAPQTAVEDNTMVQAVQANLAAEGYTLEGTSEEPLNYLVPPKAPFDWGQIVYTYSRPGATLMMREGLTLTVKLKYLKNGITVPELTVHQLLSQ